MVVNGCVPKASKKKTDFLAKCQAHIATIESSLADFDLEKLTAQIQHECVYPSGNYGKDDSIWGDVDSKAVGYCMSLIMRHRLDGKSRHVAPVFQPKQLPDVQKQIDEFLKDGNKRLMRVSLRYLSFAQSVRPIVVNAIGRHLLQEAQRDVQEPADSCSS